ncbi:MAG: S8 family peptidase [Bacteroidota bacterium]
MVKTKFLLAAALLLISHIGAAQVDRYVVFFQDKASSSFSVDRPEEFLSARAINRRTDQNITVIENDLPVNASYVSQLQDLGLETFFTTKWMNGVLVQGTAAQIAQAESLAIVSSVDFVAPGAKVTPFENNMPDLGPFFSPSDSERNTEFQNRQLGIDDMHADGYTGEGLMIAVMDGGFPGVNESMLFQHFDTEDKLVYTLDMVLNQRNVFIGSGHGTEVTSVIAGKYGDVFVGAAYDASMLLFRTEDDDSEYRIEEYNWLFAAEIADSIGVDIINSSVGYRDFDDPSMDYDFDELDGLNSVITKANDLAFSKGIIPVTSAGNTSSNITAPADAFDILSVGSVTREGNKSSFSAFFDSQDGRPKPEVVALGSSTTVLKSGGDIGTNSGTSFASPIIAGFTAGIWQAFPDATNDQITDLIKRSGTNADDISDLLGYGIPSYLRAIGSDVTNTSDELPEEITLFPNPSNNGMYRINVNEQAAFSMIVYVRDFSGKLLNVAHFDQTDQLILDISSLPSASYLVTIETGSGFYNQKVVKQ